ncbi:MAG: OPT/YSL family transporter [bacterium]|nr:OPT/YSL family transporter [bacterium]
MNTNLMAACITAGVADSASDLLTDPKSGYVLGANARKQFLAQFAGIFSAPLLRFLRFSWSFLMCQFSATKFPAPAAPSGASVLRDCLMALNRCIHACRAALVIGGIVGLLIPMCERLFPEYNKWIPSSMGLGLAFVLPFYNALSMFVSGVIAMIYMKMKTRKPEQYTVASASGIIAGESLMGIFITLMGALGWL